MENRSSPIKGRVVAFVHAKGHSDRVPSKNLQILGDRPLFCHAIANALACSIIDSVVIDSDSDEILWLGQRHGAIPLRRPGELATNTATGDDLAYWQASNVPSSAVVAQVVPTSPFLQPKTIEKAVAEILVNGKDSALSVFKESLYTWEGEKPSYHLADGRIPNSFEMEPYVFETTGLYANKTSSVLNNGKRITVENAALIPVTRIEAVDVNTEEDFEFARIILRGMQY